ncbi:MAG: ATP-binding cassette domain-containing protein [Isosphaeraceae bacterium]
MPDSSYSSSFHSSSSGVYSTLMASRALGKPVIQAIGVAYSFGSGETKSRVLDDVTVDIDQGEFVILTGPSGSGKTTLLTLIGTLRRMQEGHLSVLGRDLESTGGRQQVEIRREIGFIFQRHNLFSSLTAIQNIRMAAILGGAPGKAGRDLAVSRKAERDIDRRGRELLAALDLAKHANRLPGKLSGGESQRVAIARALVNRPRLILADEPTASLDRERSEMVIKLLRELTTGPEKTTVLIVTHDKRLIDQADRTIDMQDGRIAQNVVPSRIVPIVQLLKRLPILRNMADETVVRIAQSMTIEARRIGETIIQEGSMGDRFYLIGAGTAEAFRQGRKVAVLNQGDTFGETSGISGQMQEDTIKAKTDMELYMILESEILRIMKTDKSLEQRIRGVLATLRGTI